MLADAGADAVARCQAAVALGKAKSRGATEALAGAAKDDKEWIVRRAAVQALGEIGGQSAISALGAVLTAPKSDLQWFAASALGEVGPAAVPVLADALGAADLQRWRRWPPGWRGSATPAPCRHWSASSARRRAGQHRQVGRAGGTPGASRTRRCSTRSSR